MKWKALSVLVLPVVLSACWPRAKAPPVRIAYFLGGRTANLYRALMSGDYDSEGVEVELLAKNLYNKKGSDHHEEYRKVDRSYSLGSAPLFGKATGDELIDYMLAGKADGATVGETAFIRAVGEGKPVVAVEELGFDSKTNPGHALVLKKGILEKKIRSGQKLVLMTRRSSGGDSVFLREFFIQRGLDPDRLLDLRTNVPEDKFDRTMSERTYDGAYIHLMALLNSKDVQKNYEIHPLTWVNPEMSQAVLIFSKDFVRTHPKEIERLVRANMKRVAYDNSHPPERHDEIGASRVLRDRLLTIDFHGMELPNFRNVPTVRLDLLNEMQKLLLENGVIDHAVSLENAVDNHFVLEAAKP